LYILIFFGKLPSETEIGCTSNVPARTSLGPSTVSIETAGTLANGVKLPLSGDRLGVLRLFKLINLLGVVLGILD